MSITLREIIGSVRHLKMKLVAGEGGLDRTVSWTHMVDSNEVSAFIKPDELAFTTGVGLGRENLTLAGLVEDIFNHGGSGVVINIGPYISEIPDEVIRFGNEHDFCIFEVPWEIHMAEITRIICFAIMNEQKDTVTKSAVMMNAFFCGNREELYLPQLIQYGFSEQGSCRAAVMQLVARRPDHDKVSALFHQINTHCRCSGYHILCGWSEKNGILFLTDHDEKTSEKAFSEIYRFAIRCAGREDRIILTEGCTEDRLAKVWKSARMALRLARIVKSGRPLGVPVSRFPDFLTFRGLGVYRILLTIEDKDALKSYTEMTVDPLIQYDKANGTDITGVTGAWLDENCSLQAAADRMHIHRNTVHYQIQKAQELTHVDLRCLNGRAEMLAGFFARQLLLAEQNE